MNLWNRLGLSDNPYSPRPISGNEQGTKLLVGRENELATLMLYLSSSDTHPTLEGPNGVGKTSLVAVAGYILKKAFIEGQSQQALLPVLDPFQLTPDDNAATFKRRVFFRIAQEFVNNHEILKKRGFNAPDIDLVNLWLNSPILKTIGGGATIAGLAGINASSGASANTSAGFTEDGFVATVSSWLRDCFPTNSAGGFICIIDNLELLETSKSARSLLEAIRDELLGIQGLRWVLCGARGIVRSAASSPRLQGVLADPIMINPISSEHIKPLIEIRIEEFRIDEQAVIPVDAHGFDHVYSVGNKNLRNAMKYSEDFTFWSIRHNIDKCNPEEKYSLLEIWMAETSDSYMRDTSGVGRRAWEVFDLLAKMGGSTSPSEFDTFGFESNQAMRPHLRSLEEANLIESAIDETDNRRKTIGITPRGWIVNYKRSDFEKIGSTS